MRLIPNRVENQNWRRVQESRRQTGLRPASREATAFFDDLGRCRHGVKMEGKKEHRKQYEQPDEAPAA